MVKIGKPKDIIGKLKSLALPGIVVGIAGVIVYSIFGSALGGIVLGTLVAATIPGVGIPVGFLMFADGVAGMLAPQQGGVV